MLKAATATAAAAAAAAASACESALTPSLAFSLRVPV